MDCAEVFVALKAVNSLTSHAARQRIALKNLEIHSGHQPPKELILHIVRMGSLSSAPKIMNNDDQDNDLHLPSDISRSDLLKFCRMHGNMHDLLKRTFRKNPHEWNDFEGTTISRRSFRGIRGGEYDPSNPSVLRVFQWNVLSQALGQMNDSFARCPEEALEWNSRKFHIIEEIIQYDPDIICLQEVDHFNFLKNILETQGYSGTFFPKPDSPCIYIDGNNGPDGCAIFYRKNKFDLIDLQNKILEIWKVQSNQVVLLVTLRIRETGREVCVATTHMKARNGSVLSILRNEQGKDLIDFVKSHCGDKPLVICGDFNAEPIEPVYNTMLSDEKLKLSSAYASSGLYEEGEPPYTTWKIRDEGEICHTIDYIFYKTNDFGVEAVLELPDEDEVGEDRVPSFRYPSDHFSLACDLRLKCIGKMGKM